MTKDDPPPPPVISEELVKYLQSRFPDRAPDIDIAERHIGKLVGNLEVVRHIEALYLEQNQEGPANVLSSNTQGPTARSSSSRSSRKRTNAS